MNIFQVNQFWEFTFQCRFTPPTAGWVEAGGTLCTGQEKLEEVESEFLDVSDLRPEYNVYKAVYALAHALDDMLQCEPGRGPFSGHSCGNLQTLEPWQVRYQFTLYLLYEFFKWLCLLQSGTSNCNVPSNSERKLPFTR